MSATGILSTFEFFQCFPNEDAARLCFEKRGWGSTLPTCGHCGSVDIRECKDYKPMPYRCRSCRKHFSVRTGTVLAESCLPLQKWLLAIYMLTSARKGIPSTQMARELGITQKSAWFLAQRIRETWLKDRDGNGQKNLNPFIDKDKILQETIRFAIPGTQWIAIGITTEQFELYLSGLCPGPL